MKGRKRCHFQSEIKMATYCGAFVILEELEMTVGICVILKEMTVVEFVSNLERDDRDKDGHSDEILSGRSSHGGTSEQESEITTIISAVGTILSQENCT